MTSLVEEVNKKQSELEAEDMKLQCVTPDCHACGRPRIWPRSFVLLFTTLQLILIQILMLNVLVNLNDVSDIFKNIVEDKEDSSCLKNLWKSRLCKFLFILTSSKLT